MSYQVAFLIMLRLADIKVVLLFEAPYQYLKSAVHVIIKPLAWELC